ncbi:MAG: hypothetical protein EBS33_04305 [Alphaproteobacteria bacterium]|nr:hypothetical protein [Alphaproteobacteria bacterium]
MFIVKKRVISKHNIVKDLVIYQKVILLNFLKLLRHMQLEEVMIQHSEQVQNNRHKKVIRSNYLI